MSEKIALLFLSGPSIIKYHDMIPDLMEIYKEKNDSNFVTASVNHFPYKFVQIFNPKPANKYRSSMPVDYWFFSDVDLAQTVVDNYKGQKLVVNERIGEDKFELLKEAKVNIATTFSPIYKLEEDTGEKEYLYGMYSTSLRAIHYFIKRGYSVVIFGMDNSIDNQDQWMHFYDQPHSFTKTLDQVIDIKIQIHELKKLGKIYKVDETNNIDVDTIDLTSLIKKQIKVIKAAELSVNQDEITVTLDTPQLVDAAEIVEKIEEKLEQVILEDIKNKIITLQVPPHIKDGTLFVANGAYDIMNGVVNVSENHSYSLLEQGFKLYG